jgi:hypothetical protein
MMSSMLYINLWGDRTLLRTREWAYSKQVVGMIDLRQIAGKSLRKRHVLAIGGLWLAFSGCAWAQTGLSEPDDTKPVQITGCMTARTKAGAFVLSGVFGRPVTVIGPNYLQTGMGHQVTLTGTWQTNGISSNRKGGDEKMFVASAVKVTARQCAAPPSAPATSDSKSGKAPGGS